MVVDEKYGHMVGIKYDSLIEVPLEEVAKGQRTVPEDDPLVEAARSVGTCLGDRLKANLKRSYNMPLQMMYR
jgi:hypothetical protein